MGKRKKIRNGYTSKGQRNNISTNIISAIRRSTPEITRCLNKVKAWKTNKNPWVTVSNPNKNQTNQRFIKVRANIEWGDPKRRITNLGEKDG